MTDKLQCKECGAELAESLKFCGMCGASTQPPSDIKCPECGHENPPEFSFCGECGSSLAPKDEVEVEAPVVSSPSESGASPTPEPSEAKRVPGNRSGAFLMLKILLVGFAFVAGSSLGATLGYRLIYPHEVAEGLGAFALGVVGAVFTWWYMSSQPHFNDALYWIVVVIGLVLQVVAAAVSEVTAGVYILLALEAFAVIWIMVEAKNGFRKRKQEPQSPAQEVKQPKEDPFFF